MHRRLTLLYAWLFRQVTGSNPPGTPMTDGGEDDGHGRLDLNDAFISPLFVISAGVDAGLFDFKLWGFDFAEPLVSFSHGGAITAATLLSLFALGVAFATNRPDFSYMGAVQSWVAVATIALVIVPPFMPLLNEFLSIGIAGSIAVIIQASGFYTLAYLG